MGSILIVCSGPVWAKMPEPIFCPSPALKTPSVEHCDPDLLISACSLQAIQNNYDEKSNQIRHVRLNKKITRSH